MSIEFKIGDKVRIRNWEDMAEEFGTREDGHIPCNKTFTQGMKHLCGKEFEITELRAGGSVVSGLTDEYMISTDMIEPVSVSAKLKYDLEKMKAKIKEIEEKIVEVEAEEVVPQRISGIIEFDERASVGEKYYFMSHKEINDYEEDRDSVDEKLYADGNYFPTAELAERALFERNLYFKLMRYSYENGGSDIDWNDSRMNKPYIYYDYEDKVLKTGNRCFHREHGVVYFATEEAAESAINEFKVELIRYFTTCE